MATLRQLARRLEKLANKIDKSASNLAVEVASAIEANLLVNTPVDTSQALSNWTVTLDQPSDKFVGPKFPGSKGSTFNASVAFTLHEAKEVLKKKKPGQTIYIANNAPYIRKLNNGSSKQVPAGFVERAALIGRRVVKKGIKL